LNDGASGPPAIMGHEFAQETVSHAAAHAIRRIEDGGGSCKLIRLVAC
jgi:hypothetical protein